MRFKIYEARRGVLLRKQWRWRLVARNGRTIATSGESYNNRADVLSAIELIRAEAALARVDMLA
jgi:uncharacterized protein YegP (UPF0339 family)